MNQLNKLIEQYCEEKGYKISDVRKLDHQLSNIGDFYLYFQSFVLWLASRPTCGAEQRKFLDEVEKYGVFEYNIRHGCNQIYIRESEISCDDFTADLSKVIKGE